VCVFLAKLFVSLDVAQHGPRSPRRKIPEFYVSVLAQNMARTRVPIIPGTRYLVNTFHISSSSITEKFHLLCARQ
jgi:hypothetical protein